MNQLEQKKLARKIKAQIELERRLALLSQHKKNFKRARSIFGLLKPQTK